MYLTVCKPSVSGRNAGTVMEKGIQMVFNKKNVHFWCAVNTKIHVQCASRCKMYMFLVPAGTNCMCSACLSISKATVSKLKLTPQKAAQ
jgi:hypothetical protein